MTELTAEARETIREFMKAERQGLYIYSGISIITVIAIIGAFLSFALEELKTTGELAALSAIESMRTTHFDPMIREFQGRLYDAGQELEEERREFTRIQTILDGAQAEIEELAAIAEQATTEIHQAEGSFVFADRFSDVSTRLHNLTSRLEALEENGQEAIVGVETEPVVTEPDEGPSLLERFPGEDNL